MRLLILIASQYGERIVAHLYQHAPDNWHVMSIPSPMGLPPVVDEAEEYLPAGLLDANLVLYLGESERAAQLLPAIAARTGAQAIIAPIDNAGWIPPGLRGQLTRELRAMGVEIVFPEPFCSLTEDGLGAVTGEFARHFGRPRLNVRIDPVTQALAEIVVERGSPCGSTHFAAEKARGLPVTEAIPHAGLICLHYPCLASMQPEQTESGVETLMHTSGKIFNAALDKALMAAC
ncbi:MAG TPA: DUF166 family protein [Anaerolineales bacterium]|nr:DUF166 family protein [Anaerolineales bacterium]